MVKKHVNEVSWESPPEASPEEIATNHGLTKQCIAAFIVSLSALNCGIAIPWVEPVSLGLEAGANVIGRWPDRLVGYVILKSFYPGFFSGLFLGLVANFYGRKPVIYLACVLNIIGGGIIANATNDSSQWIGKACVSCYITSALLVGPMILSEIAHKRIRGCMMMFCAVQMNLGMLVGYSFGHYFAMNTLIIINIVISVVQLLLFIIVPESPYFLVSKSRLLEAEGALFWSRGSHRSIAKGELAILVRISALTQNHTFVQTLQSYGTIKAISISIGLVFFQRLSGSTIFVCYSNAIFNNSGTPVNAHDATIALAGLQTVASLFTLCLIDFVGRKYLLYVSHSANLVFLSILTVYLITTKLNENPADSSWLPFACYCGFIFFNSLGVASMSSIISNEISPIKMKGVILTLDSVLTSLLVLGVLELYSVLNNHVGAYINFLIPAVMNAIGLLFTWLAIPKTNGLTLYEIVDRRNRNTKDTELLKSELTHF